MSYILDALQKAERERDLARVPSLGTVHAESPGKARRFGLWAVAVAFLVGAGVPFWLLIRSPSVDRPAAGKSLGRSADRRPEGGGDLHRALARLEAALAPPSSPEAPAPTRPGPDTRLQPPGRSGRKESAAVSPPPVPSPAPTTLRPPQRESPRGVSQAVQPAESEPAQPEEDTSTPAEEGEGAPSEAASQPVQTQAPAQREGARAGAPAQTPPPPTDNTPALLEAIARMRLEIFVYSDVQEKRMVVIDGRRYVEGDQIGGRFLLEAITSEGAVLSHGGARAVLRP